MSLYLFDQNMRVMINGIVPESAVLDSLQNQKLNGVIGHKIEVLYQYELEQCTYFGLNDIDDESIFWVYKVTDRNKHDGKIVLNGIHKFFDDLKGMAYIKDIRPSGVTPPTVFKQIFADTGWTLGAVSATNTSSASFYYVSPLDAFWDALEIWNVEFKLRMTFSGGKITGQYVDLATQVSANYGKWYEYGDKLIKVEAETKEESIFTALVGRGKGLETEAGGYSRKIVFDDVSWSIASGNPVDKPVGQSYVEIPEATLLYGYPGALPRIGIVDFDDITDPLVLLNETYEVLLEASRPKVEFSADVLETELVELGETVTIIRDDLNIRYQTRVFEITRSFLSKNIKSIRFGDHINKTPAERIKAEKKEQVKIYSSISEIVSEYVTNMEFDFLSGNGYNYELKPDNEYGLPAGIYSFNKPIDQSPTSVVGISGGYLVLSNDKNPDGTWKWGTLADGAGLGTGVVGADQIISGSIKTDHIAAGAIDAEKIAANAISTEHIAAGGISAGVVLLSSGKTAEQEILALSTTMSNQPRTFTEFIPGPPYKTGDIWAPRGWTLDELDAKFSQLLYMTGRLPEYTIADFSGGVSYVAIANNSQAPWALAQKAHWLNTGMGSSYFDHLRDGIVYNRSLLDDYGLAVEAYRKTTDELVMDVTQVKAGMINVVHHDELGKPGATVIIGDNITTGRIRSQNDASWLDIKNGEFSWADGLLTWLNGQLNVKGVVEASTGDRTAKLSYGQLQILKQGNELFNLTSIGGDRHVHMVLAEHGDTLHVSKSLTSGIINYDFMLFRSTTKDIATIQPLVTEGGLEVRGSLQVNTKAMLNAGVDIKGDLNATGRLLSTGKLIADAYETSTMPESVGFGSTKHAYILFVNQYGKAGILNKNTGVVTMLATV